MVILARFWYRLNEALVAREKEIDEAERQRFARMKADLEQEKEIYR